MEGVGAPLSVAQPTIIPIATAVGNNPAGWQGGK
jgi:hypothetical protein